MSHFAAKRPRFRKSIGLVVVHPRIKPLRPMLLSIHRTAAEALAAGISDANVWWRNQGGVFIVHDRRHPAIQGWS